MAIKNLIFDCGGVLITRGRTPMEQTIGQMFSIPMEQAKKVWQESILDLLKGQRTSRQVIASLRQKYHSPHDEQTLMRLWTEAWIIQHQEINLDLLKYISLLKDQYALYILTDTIDVYDELIEINIYKNFNKIFRSWEQNVVKPDLQAFKNVLRQTNSQPEETVLIDDVASNVTAAEVTGMKGLVFTSTPQLITDLAELGVEAK